MEYRCHGKYTCECFKENCLRQEKSLITNIKQSLDIITEDLGSIDRKTSK